MINFYEYYNKNGLDNEHYGPLLTAIDRGRGKYTDELQLIKHIIKNDPRCIYAFAKYIIKGRWHEAESAIMKDTEYTFWYAKDVIKGRWPEAEPIIMKSPRYAYSYAQVIINDRWHEAEQYIMENNYWWHYYCKDFNIC